jgi:peptide-methionine (S)-S-oxide reductase
MNGRGWFAAAIGAAVVATLAGFVTLRPAAEEARVVPAPLVDVPASERTSAVAVIAGGCFWGVQGVFQHVKGVTMALSGYAGGEAGTAEYATVGTGRTGHAESVRIEYDPRQISYGRILQIFFSVVHDPTQVDRQGPDHGTQYRTAIFPMDGEQEKVARAYISQLDAAHAFDRAIATKVETGKTFYPAEGYHQDYLWLHPTQPYVAINDVPKVADLKRLFPEVYQAKPVLVGRAKPRG